MWIVRIALTWPYTFIVLGLLILIVSMIVILRTPTDIFPSIDIPVVAVAWTYSGLVRRDANNSLTAFTVKGRITVTRRISIADSSVMLLAKPIRPLLFSCTSSGRRS
jgi:multidrug efflux pump subunit AcrB